ncbi:SPOR domain-containing protein [Thiocystis violacea]|uniref:SPOR domain-containing protein n=1 Tax=Thiocystis violacea TaxID=13725 RepID=UPI0019064CCB|nr:hypothetical protein [Thiocystis violacea]MBK1723717.1 hypothetical protein [Thiocystis violacea]
MENMNDKDLRDPSTPKDAPAEKTEAKPGGKAPEPAASGAQPTSLEALAGEVRRLAEELQQQKIAFQDTEVSLVARIADVDDDRRHSATRLQRIHQAQRDELDERFKRQSTLITVLLLLFLLLAGSAMAFVYVQLNGVKQSLSTEIEGLRQSLKDIEIPQASSTEPLTRQKLSELSETVDQLSVSLERLGDAEEPIPPQERDSPDLASKPATADTTQAAPTPSPATPSGAAGQTLSEEATQSPGATQPPTADAKPTPEPTLVSEAATEPSAEEPAAEMPELPSQPEEGPATTAERASKDAQEPAQLQVGDTPFTVQLMGFFSLDSLRQFVKEHQISTEVYYQTTSYQDRPWFVLIHSLHPTQASAEAAAAALPQDLAKLDIWVRRLDANTAITRLRNGQD